MRNVNRLTIINAGDPVEGCEPTATVYPNYAKENYPAIPNYIGWTLEPLQGLVRGSIKGIFGELFGHFAFWLMLILGASISRRIWSGYVDRDQSQPK